MCGHHTSQLILSSGKFSLQKQGWLWACVSPNENKAKLLTVADFCTARQVEFPIIEYYIGVLKTCGAYSQL